MARDKSILTVEEFLTIAGLQETDLVDQTARYEALISAAGSFIIGYIGRDCFGNTEKTEFFNGEDNYPADKLFPACFPITAVTSLADDLNIPATHTGDTLLIEDTDFGFDSEEIFLYSGLTFGKGRNNIKLVYESGFEIGVPESQGGVPNDLILACSEIVSFHIKMRGNVHLASRAVETIASTDRFRNDLPEFVFGTLDRYRKINV